MKFVEVLLTVCTIASPVKCEEVKRGKIGEITPYACFRYGQIEAEKFLQGREDVIVTKWRCSKPTEDI